MSLRKRIVERTAFCILRAHLPRLPRRFLSFAAVFRSRYCRNAHCIETAAPFLCSACLASSFLARRARKREAVLLTSTCKRSSTNERVTLFSISALQRSALLSQRTLKSRLRLQAWIVEAAVARVASACCVTRFCATLLVPSSKQSSTRLRAESFIVRDHNTTHPAWCGCGCEHLWR